VSSIREGKDVISSLKQAIQFKALINNIQFHVSNADEWVAVEADLSPSQARAIKEVLRARVTLAYREMLAQFAGIDPDGAVYEYEFEVQKAIAVLCDGETYDE